MLENYMIYYIMNLIICNYRQLLRNKLLNFLEENCIQLKKLQVAKNQSRGELKLHILHCSVGDDKK